MIYGINREPIESIGTIRTNLWKIPCNFHIVNENLNIDMDDILGRDILDKCDANISFKNKQFDFSTPEGEISIKYSQKVNNTKDLTFPRKENSSQDVHKRACTPVNEIGLIVTTKSEIEPLVKEILKSKTKTEHTSNDEQKLFLDNVKETYASEIIKEKWFNLVEQQLKIHKTIKMNELLYA